jgi:hypothetical protein
VFENKTLEVAKMIVCKNTYCKHNSIYGNGCDGWQDFTIDNLPNLGDLIAIFPAPEQCTKPYIDVFEKNLEWIDGDKWYRLPSFKVPAIRSYSEPMKANPR